MRGWTRAFIGRRVRPVLWCGMLVAGLIIILGVSLVISPAAVPVTQNSPTSQKGSLLPHAATPTPTVSATPSATPTPTVEPSVPVEAEVCSTAHISAPKARAKNSKGKPIGPGIDAEIEEYTYEQLVKDDGFITPPTDRLERAVWYSGLFTESGLDSVMSAAAEYPVLISGHRYRSEDIDAVFDNLKELKVGDIVTVTTCADEVIRLVVEDTKSVPQEELMEHLPLYQPDPGVWYMVTCFSVNDDPSSGPPEANTVVKLRVVQP